MAKQVSLTINGKTVSVPEGTLIVNAAKMVGITIPVFCFHPKMEPVGMCRQCLVEVGRPMFDRTTRQPVLDEDGKQKIQFGPKLETSCTTPVSEGMVVLTNSEKAREGQNDILEFLLTSHPLDCPVCDKGGECPLQNQTMAFGPDESRFIFSDKMHLAKKYPLGELIYLDRERCIQCARCIRFQDQNAGEPVLGFYQRGRSMEIISNSDPGFDSIFSGNTTDICPVGALTTTDFRFGAAPRRDGQDKKSEQVSLNLRIGARPWELKAAASICGHCPVCCNLTFNTRRESSTGRVGIKRVMPRQNEAVNEIWICDKGRFAYHFVEDANRLEKPQVRKNGELVAVPWEEAINKIGKLELEKKGKAVVLAGGRLPNEDLFILKQLADGLGGEALLYTHMGGGEYTTAYGMAAGSNFADMGKGTTLLVVASDLYNEAPVWFLRVKQAAERGATLILVTARESKLEKYARFVVRYAYGDEVKTVDGLAKDDKIGEVIQSAENLVVLYGSDGLGLEGSSVLAAACADLVKSRAGKTNNGLIGVWSRANDQGAWELGYKLAEDLQSTFDDADLVLIAGADPVGDGVIKTNNKKLKPFVIVQELFLTETARLADIILPAQAYIERDGSFTSGERRLQRFYPVLPAHGETRPDYAIAASLARELGIELEARSVTLVFEKVAASVKAFEGLSYGSLAVVKEQWPTIGRSDMYYGGTSYQNSQGLGVTLMLNSNPSSEGRGEYQPLRPDEEHWLAVPITRLYDRGITVSTSRLLGPRTGEAVLLLHPDSAKSLGLEAGGKVHFNGGSFEVRLDPSVPARTVLVPRSMDIPCGEPMIVEIKAA
jgi:NADH-quinone oxidoreductase subunit G